MKNTKLKSESQRARIGLLTTIQHNIGDDLIRFGIKKIIHSYSGEKPEFIPVHKHTPYEIYEFWQKLPQHKKLDRLLQQSTGMHTLVSSLLARSCSHRWKGVDVVVQCGAPFFWPDCHKCEWAKPIWYDVMRNLSRHTSILNIALGAAYPWESRDSIELTDEDAAYITHQLSSAKITTVRDSLAQKICSELAMDVRLLPCTAFLAAMDLYPDNHRDTIVVNYMYGAGHYDWGQNVDGERWVECLRTVIQNFRKRFKIAFLCHNTKEVDLAKQTFGDVDIVFPKTPEEYFECSKRFLTGICNRMHASVGLAGMGIPTIAVCTDTRLLMVEQLGLPIFYVKDVAKEQIANVLTRLVDSAETERERLKSLQKRVWEDYHNIFQGHFVAS